MPEPEPRLERPPAQPDFFDRLKRFFSVGPFAWVFGSLPERRLFRPGRGMHGLDRHDIVERPLPRRPSETERNE
jgi:hypothetical protein